MAARRRSEPRGPVTPLPEEYPAPGWAPGKREGGYTVHEGSGWSRNPSLDELRLRSERDLRQMVKQGQQSLPADQRSTMYDPDYFQAGSRDD